MLGNMEPDIERKNPAAAKRRWLDMHFMRTAYILCSSKILRKKLKKIKSAKGRQQSCVIDKSATRTCLFRSY